MGLKKNFLPFSLKENVQYLGPSTHQKLFPDQSRSEFITLLAYHFIQSPHTGWSFLLDDFLPFLGFFFFSPQSTLFPIYFLEAFQCMFSVSNLFLSLLSFMADYLAQIFT